MSDASESLIRRIQKLLALSASPNEHEAQAAAAKAQELLAAHGLEMAEVQAKHVKDGAASSGPAERVKDSLNSSAMYNFQRDLMRCIASNNFCYYMITEQTRPDPRAKYGTRTVKVHTLIGSHLNVTVATLLYDYLIHTMDRLLPWQGREKRGKNALLWLAGCSDRLSSRLDALRVEQEKADKARQDDRGNGRSLVTLTDLHGTENDLNMDHLYGWAPGRTAELRRAREAAQAAADAAWKLEVEAARSRPAEVFHVKPETEAQHRKREARERRWREQSDRRWAKQSEKYRSSAYQRGSEAADDIGLDRQVDHTKTQEIA